MSQRFSLPDGTLTTYDSYSERALPDGRVCSFFDCTVMLLMRIICIASWLVVRHPHRMATRNVPQS